MCKLVEVFPQVWNADQPKMLNYLYNILIYEKTRKCRKLVDLVSRTTSDSIHTLLKHTCGWLPLHQTTFEAFSKESFIQVPSYENKLVYPHLISSPCFPRTNI